jgi:uncharacterized protein YndB with AHSA1/START domain
MTDVSEHLKTIRRTVEGDAVILRRTYDTSIDDLWDAISNGERIARWFLPVSGDLRLGGRYQLEGNAGGEIVACEPPRLLRVTWVIGSDATEVEARLSTTDADATALELIHSGVTKAQNWAQFGPGAVGVGWDLTLHGLGLHLATGAGRPADPIAWMMSPEGKEFSTTSSDLWGEALLATGADPGQVAAMVDETTRAYTGA